VIEGIQRLGTLFVRRSVTRPVSVTPTFSDPFKPDIQRTGSKEMAELVSSAVALEESSNSSSSSSSSSSESNNSSEVNVNEAPIGTYAESEATKKTIGDIMATDTEDEGLQKYKENLLGGAAAGQFIGDPSDPRRLFIVGYTIAFDPDQAKEKNLTNITHDLSSAEGLANIEKQGISIKEGSRYQIRIRFKIHGDDIVPGMTFKTEAKRAVFSEKDQVSAFPFPYVFIYMFCLLLFPSLLFTRKPFKSSVSSVSIPPLGSLSLSLSLSLQLHDDPY
jgi:hypothetical protein